EFATLLVAGGELATLPQPKAIGRLGVTARARSPVRHGPGTAPRFPMRVQRRGQLAGHGSVPSAHSRAAASGPGAVSHNFTLPSCVAAASALPSGEKATEYTSSACPFRANNSLPVAACHSRTVRSELPEARVLPSGANATDQTPPVCPHSTATS